ncbi:MAG: hypothetical protein JO053_10890 [Acidobacteria bacterium]|nr:hypothetical protein [Acidobacteriota bacterium]
MTKNLILALAATLFFSSLASSQDSRVLAEATRISGDRFAVAAVTPRGAHVYAVSGPSVAVLNAVDKGLGDLFAVARKNGYYRRLKYSDYSIYIARADRTRDYKGDYSPDIAVGAAQYTGSVYDQGGFIYAAGIVISNDPCSLLIAEHSKNIDRISNVVRYEGEHLVLYHNDRRRYMATMDHSRGGAHPILQ